VTAREGTRQEDAVHGRQRAAGRESRLLGAGLAAQNLRRFYLQTIRETSLKALAALQRVDDRPDDDLRVVAQHVGVVALPEVQNAMAVLIPDEGSMGFRNARRERRSESARVAHAIHQALFGSFVQRSGLRCVMPISLPKFRQNARMISQSIPSILPG